MPRGCCENSELQRGTSRNNERISCNCGWELRLGYGVAMSLAIFEAKRFFLLALELFVEWQVIRFAGGLIPVVLTFVDITLGFPCALAAVYTIRKRQSRPFCPNSPRFFGYLLAIISTCVLLNIATMMSIGYRVSVGKRALASVFNASMQLYLTSASSKFAVDQTQLILQCCGHTSYTDWFLFDWQMVDYASREDMSRQRRISDEIYRDHGVPFSCCNYRVLRACLHFQINNDNDDTINSQGCSGVLSNVLVRIVFVAYVMTTMLVLTQALLAFFLARIAKKFQNNDNNTCSELLMEYSPGISTPLVDSTWSIGSEEYSSPSSHNKTEKATETRKPSTKIRKKRKRGGGGVVISRFSDITEDSTVSDDTARIKPSVHAEHRIPKRNNRNRVEMMIRPS